MEKRSLRYDTTPSYPRQARGFCKNLTTSKKLLLIVMLTYFSGVALGVFLVLEILTNHPDYAIQAFLGLLTYIGGPTGVTIAFYSWKAKNENVCKINGRLPEQDEDEE